MNASCSIWGLDWATGIEGEHHPQYLAVGGYKGTIQEHHLLDIKEVVTDENDTKLRNCIQIWTIPHINDTQIGI